MAPDRTLFVLLGAWKQPRDRAQTCGHIAKEIYRKVA
jgi:hypothetical protein